MNLIVQKWWCLSLVHHSSNQLPPQTARCTPRYRPEYDHTLRNGTDSAQVMRNSINRVATLHCRIWYCTMTSPTVLLMDATVILRRVAPTLVCLPKRGIASASLCRPHHTRHISTAHVLKGSLTSTKSHQQAVPPHQRE